MALSSKRMLASICGVFAFLLLSALPASATTLTRTFISNSGNDGNSCAADSPCLTLNGAYGKTSAAGEINILTGGDYGNLTITKSITIRGEGNILGVTDGLPGITVTAGATDVVTLVGLDILGDGVSGADDGIKITGAGIVNISDCQFHDLFMAVDVAPSGANTFVSVKDSSMQNNTYGVYVVAASVTAKVVIDNIAAFGTGLSGIDTGAGISANGADAFVVVNNSTIANNGTGLQVAGGASLFTYGNNRVNFNGDNGGPNQAILTLK